MGSHEDTSPAFFGRTFTSQTVKFAIVINSVIFQLSKFDILMLVFDFLGGSVILLLAFLTTTSETEYQVKSGFFLDVIVGQSSAIFQLFSSKNQTLLIWRNSFLVLDLCLDIFNGIRGFNFKSNCFSSQSFNKYLHSSSETKYKMKR